MMFVTIGYKSGYIHESYLCGKHSITWQVEVYGVNYRGSSPSIRWAKSAITRAIRKAS